MEFKYTGSYTGRFGRRYAIGEIDAMLGYAIEIADPGVRLEEGKLAPGEICMLIFGLAQEEYTLKDTDTRQLDMFAELLAKRVPADRLIGWRILNLKGEMVKRDIRVKPLCESMDEGAFARRVRKAMAGPMDETLLETRRLQKLCADAGAPDGVKQDWLQARRTLGEKLLGLERVYVAEEALMGGKWPCVGFDGRIDLFTTLKRAQNMLPQVSSAHGGVQIWSIREIPAGEIETYLRRCSANGLNLLRLDNGFAAVQMQIGDFMETEKGENIAPRSFIIREMEAGIRWNKMKQEKAPEDKQRAILEGVLTLRNFARREIGNAMLYAICKDGVRGRCIILGKKDVGDKVLPAFTDSIQAAAFAERIDGNQIPVAMSFDDLCACAKTEGCDLVIDANVLPYRIPAADFEAVKELRNKPPVQVRIRQEEKKGAPAPTVKQDASLGSLPNPDDFDVPARGAETPAEDQAKADEENVASENQSAQDVPKKGFFRKLFGK